MKARTDFVNFMKPDTYMDGTTTNAGHVPVSGKGEFKCC